MGMDQEWQCRMQDSIRKLYLATSGVSLKCSSLRDSPLQHS